MVIYLIKQCCAPLEESTVKSLKAVTGKDSLKEALTEAVRFTIARYRQGE